MESRQLEKRSADSRFLERLPDEVNYWQERGIIAPEQGRAIIDSYEMPNTARAAHGRLVTILAILGSVLVGLESSCSLRPTGRKFPGKSSWP